MSFDEAIAYQRDLSAGLRFADTMDRTGAGAAARRERRANSGPPPPYRSVGASSMNSSTGGYSESMSQRNYNAWRDAGGGGGSRRR
jgi:hypothetical protein